jgi:hypothetical protein
MGTIRPVGILGPLDDGSRNSGDGVIDHPPVYRD